MTRRYSGTIVGFPYAFARPGVNRETGARYDPERYSTWKEAAGFAGLGIRRGGRLLEGPLALELIVTPDGVAFDVYEVAASTRETLNGDLDNYAKALLDALQNGVLYKDDRQVELLVARFAPALEHGTPAPSSGR